jgi:hypothetical protein
MHPRKHHSSVAVRFHFALVAVILSTLCWLRSTAETVGNESRERQRMFGDMSVVERNKILGEILKNKPLVVFRAWIDAGRIEHDPVKQRAIGWVFSGVLRQGLANADLYKVLQLYVADNVNPFFERGQVLWILGEAKNRESLDLLIQIATTSPEEGLRMGAANEIQSAGSLWGDGRFHEELSPALEMVWRESKDRFLLMNVAFAMAKVGAPTGVRELMASENAFALPAFPLLGFPMSDAAFRKQIATEALREVLNPQSLPILKGTAL